jgi:hypothetical protein
MNANMKSILVLAIMLAPPAIGKKNASGDAGGQDWRAPIQNRLEAKYALTKASANKSDIVKAGAVLVLKKDNLVMLTTDMMNLAPNVYKDGRITQGFIGRSYRLPGSTNSRVFVKGEKFWLERVDVKDDGVVLEFLSDPFDDVRYKGTLRFPFPKLSPPPIERIEELVAQVIDVDGGDQAAAGSQPPAPAPAPVAPPAEAPAAPIAPPPPPPEDPKSISVGQTKDQVEAAFGQPLRQAKVGVKLIYVYKDLKVVFVNGKVTDVQ